MKTFKSFFLGLLILPWTLSTVWQLPGAVLSIKSHPESLALLFSGVAAYVFFEVIFSRPMRTYVFGHELTHALASLALGGKVHDLKVSAKGGSVSLSKTNFFVALAPYCIPLYAFAVLIGYWILKKYYPFEGLETVFFVFVGATLAFHGSLTIYAVRQEQPDIKKSGTFFSLIFIVFMNSWILVFISKLLFWGSVSFKGFFTQTLRTQADIWHWLWVTGLAAYDKITVR